MTTSILEALARFFPTYFLDERESSPLNSSPYVGSQSQLHEAFENDEQRKTLLKNVDEVLDTLEQQGLKFTAVLIGGGFIRRLKCQTQPNDIDGLAFYKITTSKPEDAIRALAGAKPLAKAKHLDLRFCPIDADPITLIRSVAFFSTLYSKREGSMTIENGLILYDRGN